MGGPIPLRVEAQTGPSAALALWCVIYQVGGKHTTNNCHLFCNFCMSVGHDEKNCPSYELLMDRTPTYRMQTEMQGLDLAMGMVHARFQGLGQG